MNKSHRFLLIALSAVAFFASQAMAWNYPEDSGYANVPTINAEDLFQKYQAGTAMVIDVRSKIEYDTAHLKDALHLPLANRSFVVSLGELLQGSKAEHIVFYCNGGSCLKAPEAVVKSVENGIKNGLAFYEGLPGWAALYPEDTVLRGKPVSTDNQLISKEEFRERCLSFEEFKQKISVVGNNAVIVDIRDHIQKSGALKGLGRTLSVPLDNFTANFLSAGKNKDKTLFIFDQVGRQIQSVQYELREYDYTDYWFLDKGATDVLGKQNYK